MGVTAPRTCVVPPDLTADSASYGRPYGRLRDCCVMTPEEWPVCPAVHLVRWRRRCHVATSDPIADIIGDYRAFAAMQRDRLSIRGIDISPYALSHLAVRVADWHLYVHQRTLLERHARANREKVWNGRPISLIMLAEPLDVLDGALCAR